VPECQFVKIKFKIHFSDFVVGFDIVGQEDIGKPLSDFTKELLTAKEKYPNLR